MKGLMAGLLAVAVMVPAAQVRHDETERGASELITTTQTKVDAAAKGNKAHTWVNVDGYNFAQKYRLQKELEAKGYDFDFSLFGSTWVGW